jgi:glycerol-3-phosphate dehydrogenase (NAD(P)+)
MKICIYGAGAWGTALAVSAARHHQVTLYGRNASHVAALAQERSNVRYLAGVSFPDALRVTSSLETALADAKLLVLATPVAGLRQACVTARAYFDQPPVWLCKGFEEDTAMLPHEVVGQALRQHCGASLSGPSFALEVANALPTALTVASDDEVLRELVIEAFHHDALRVYSSEDVIGVEVGGALKNVLAIATGICDGLELGLNARAALITRGLAEMMRLGEALGARSETLMGLSGVGDLILTCTGALSRNRKVGLALGQGATLDQVLGQLGHVAEGVRCAAAVLERAAAAGIEMPICEAVHGVLFKQVAPRSAVARLLARAPRAEL